MKIHPAANAMPEMSESEFRELVDDISRRGLLSPIAIFEDQILDGRHRWKACQELGVEPATYEADLSGLTPEAFVWSVNGVRRHLTQSQKACVALQFVPGLKKAAKQRQLSGLKQNRDRGGKIPTTEAGKSRDQAAAIVGVDGKYVTQAAAIKKRSPKLFAKVKSGRMTISKAKKEIEKQARDASLKKAQATVSDAIKHDLDSVCDLRHCSCGELFASGIRPEVVITDPPYPKDFLGAFTVLAECCADAKVPLVAAMSGQSYLPEVFERMCRHLKYRWTIAYLTPGGQAVQQWAAKVNAFWKPVLVFGEGVDWFGDVARSDTNDNDKRFHGWGQSESGMADLVSRLSKPGDLVCDPFLGGGTTAVVSLALGRRFVGCDSDPNAVIVARGRLLTDENVRSGTDGMERRTDQPQASGVGV